MASKTMGAMMSDNGGEFNADEIREVASILNVELCTTAAESPFQNGLCERIHAVTDSMLLKLQEQCPVSSHSFMLCSIFGSFSSCCFTIAPTQQYAMKIIFRRL